MLDNTFSLVNSFLDTEGMCPHDYLPLTEELCVLLSKSFLEIEPIRLNPKSLPAAIPIRLITRICFTFSDSCDYTAHRRRCDDILQTFLSFPDLKILVILYTILINPKLLVAPNIWVIANEYSGKNTL